jgi:hypothetical protein
MASPPQDQTQLDLFADAEATRSPAVVAARSAEPAGDLEAHARGAIHEKTLDERGTRKSSGSYYTPPDVVEGLLDLALGPLLQQKATEGITAVANLRILDPACGSGNFLVAAGRRIAAELVALGLAESAAASIAFGACLSGVDLDLEALEICRSTLARAGGSARTPAMVLHADSLLMVSAPAGRLLGDGESDRSWSEVISEVGCVGGGYDLVIGNPPFLSQLDAATARGRDYGAELRLRFGEAAAGYADPAALFLLLATRLARPRGGVVCLIEPQSVLSARDAMPTRQAVLSAGSITAAWVSDTRIFDAGVDVCAPVITLGAGSQPITVSAGRAFRPLSATVTLGPGARSWSALLAAVKAYPNAVVGGARRVEDIAAATADFRDQYYGLAPHVVDAQERTDLPPLVTSGAIDPAHLLWGTRPAKFNKTAYQHPRVVVDDLDVALRVWAEKRLVPKVLLATQTKVLEAIVDRKGELLPSVPVITITAKPEHLYRLGALLVSPPVTLVAAQRHLGAALSSDALKLSAREVLDLPLPDDMERWEQAGRLFETASNAESFVSRRDHLVRSGRAMCLAFGITDHEELLNWWKARLPKDRDGA